MPQAGYFYDYTAAASMLLDGSPSVMVSYAVPATLIDFRESAASPVTKGPNLFRQGGTVLQINVKGAFIREQPKGDGEWWAYTLLSWLGGSWIGELAVNGQAHTLSVFLNGTVSIVAGMHDSGPTNTSRIEYSLNFLRSVPAATTLPAPSYSAVAQSAYAGRTNNADYTAGSRPLGANGSRAGHAEISSISVRRPVQTVVVPRAFGAEIVNQPRGRELEFALECHNHVLLTSPPGDEVACRAQLEEYLHDTEVGLAESGFTLTGNGNTFPSGASQLVRIEPDQLDRWLTLPYTTLIRQKLLT